MARQSLGQKKVNKLIKSTGLDIVHVLVRGGTNHTKDLCIKGGDVFHLYKNGDIEKSDIGWVK
jgi:hypothetical protein